jgi:hypothetical protein
MQALMAAQAAAPLQLVANPARTSYHNNNFRHSVVPSTEGNMEIMVPLRVLPVFIQAVAEELVVLVVLKVLAIQL